MQLRSIACRIGKPAGPWPVLAVVLVVELALFAGHHWERWTKAILRLEDPRAQSGEGLVIRCDGLGYYAWLRSLLIDGDLSFDNEFDEHNVIGDYVPPAPLAVASLTLGTPIVYYSAIEVSMAHGIATAALASFICYWLKSYGSDRMRRWVLAGFLLGLAGLMRWQLLGFAVLLAGEALF